jgi:hypothetical protein
MKKVSLISLGLLTICAMFTVGANAQSLTSAPKPSAEIMQLTKSLEGEWSLSVKFEPSSSAPNGVANSGEETWRPGPGGFTLLEEEHLRAPEGDLSLFSGSSGGIPRIKVSTGWNVKTCCRTHVMSRVR